MARTIAYGEVVDAVAKICQEANFCLPEDVREALRRALAEEVSPPGQDVLRQLLENASIAAREEVPMCQDTGVAVVFLEVGQEVTVSGGFLYDAVQEGVRRGYTEGYLRKSMVGHPLVRKNTGDNTPAVIHTTLVPGDRLRITVAPKGAGSENMSSLAMLTPAAGVAGVKKFVVETVRRAGPNPCPPVVVGVGLGGDFELCAILAKKALLRPLADTNPDPELDRLEKELLAEINCTGIGPQGLGGRITALAVKVEAYGCHIASLPVAVNLSCHALRHATMVL